MSEPETGTSIPGPQRDLIYAHYYHSGVLRPPLEEPPSVVLSKLKEEGLSEHSDDER
jgi:hypothetical protein